MVGLKVGEPTTGAFVGLKLKLGNAVRVGIFVGWGLVVGSGFPIVLSTVI